MKILMLGWELPPHNSGGLGVACYHMSKALSEKGASIDFVVPYEAEHPIDFMNIHAATSLAPIHKNGMGAYDSSSKLPKELHEVQTQYENYVKELVQRDRPHVVHAHDWLTMKAGIVAKQVSGVPLIVHVHATEFDRSGELYGNPVVHDIEQQGLLLADRIIAVSEITKRIIIDRYDIPADKIDVVHNTLDINSLGEYMYDADTYLYLETMRQEGYTVVSTIGRLTVQKGITYFLRAAAKASERHDKLLFLIAGDGELKNELIEQSAELGIADKVFFTGFIRGQKWRDSYTVADIFVMSSVSEPFGLTALEAAAHETAILLSRQSGVGEVLDNVMRFDYWDTDKLADEIVGIATSSSLSGELKDNVGREFNRVSWSDIAEIITHVYKKTASEVIA